MADEFRFLEPEELGLKAPCILAFMPTRKIWAKLIRRATQITDIIGELNPSEAKTDPRKMEQGIEES